MWLGLSLGMDKLNAGIWSFSRNSKVSSKFRHCSERKDDTIVRIWHFMEIYFFFFGFFLWIDAIACLGIYLLLFCWLLPCLDYWFNFRWLFWTHIFCLLWDTFSFSLFFFSLFSGKNSFMLSFVCFHLQIFL